MSLSFPNSSLYSLPKPTSDHTPIQLPMSTTIPKANLFRFENAWLKHSDFLPAVLPAWLRGSTHGVAAAIVGSLKAVRCASKAWARRKSVPPTLLPNCKFVMYLHDVLEEGRCLSAGEHLLRRDCQDHLVLVLRERAAYWKQRGKHHAIQEGDANTRFFHAQATQRLHCNNIRALEVDGVVVSSHQDKTAALTSHHQGLLRVNTAASDSIGVAALYAESEATLLAPFMELEARIAVCSMNRSSSLGPDGFGPAFYAAAWSTVVPTVMELAWAFQAGTAELEHLNRSYIVMISKHAAATTPGDYRPICLQNCSLKIISKMLTTWLQH